MRRIVGGRGSADLGDGDVLRGKAQRPCRLGKRGEGLRKRIGDLRRVFSRALNKVLTTEGLACRPIVARTGCPGRCREEKPRKVAALAKHEKAGGEKVCRQGHAMSDTPEGMSDPQAECG